MILIHKLRLLYRYLRINSVIPKKFVNQGWTLPADFLWARRIFTKRESDNSPTTTFPPLSIHWYGENDLQFVICFFCWPRQVIRQVETIFWTGNYQVQLVVELKSNIAFSYILFPVLKEKKIIIFRWIDFVTFKSAFRLMKTTILSYLTISIGFLLCLNNQDST